MTLPLDPRDRRRPGYVRPESTQIRRLETATANTAQNHRIWLVMLTSALIALTAATGVRLADAPPHCHPQPDVTTDDLDQCRP